MDTLTFSNYLVFPVIFAILATAAIHITWIVLLISHATKHQLSRKEALDRAEKIRRKQQWTWICFSQIGIIAGVIGKLYQLEPKYLALIAVTTILFPVMNIIVLEAVRYVTKNRFAPI